MGGFRINGFGVSDRFYPIKNLGEHQCAYCHQTMQEWSVMEVRRKIDVFYIPTITVNTKYAVACKKCKNGRYISDEERVGLLSDSLKLRVSGTSVYLEPVEMDTHKQ